MPQQLQHILSHTKTASAYRPRHKEKANCQKLESLTFYTKINHIPKNKNPHIHLSQLEITTLTPPNSHITTKATLIIHKIYNKLTNIPHSKVCYKFQYTYNLLKIYYTLPQYKYHPTPNPQRKCFIPIPYPTPSMESTKTMVATQKNRYHKKLIFHPKPKLNLKPTQHLRNKPRPKYNTYSIPNPYSKPETHLRSKLHPKPHRIYNLNINYKPEQYTQQNHINSKTYEKNNSHPKHNPPSNPENCPLSKSNSHSKHKRHLKPSPLIPPPTLNKCQKPNRHKYYLFTPNTSSTHQTTHIISTCTPKTHITPKTNDRTNNILHSKRRYNSQHTPYHIKNNKYCPLL